MLTRFRQKSHRSGRGEPDRFDGYTATVIDPWGLRVARRRPEIDPALDGEAVDLRQLGGREGEVVERLEVVVELGDRARPDQGRGDPRIAQRPGEGHLRQRLPTPARDLAECP